MMLFVGMRANEFSLNMHFRNLLIHVQCHLQLPFLLGFVSINSVSSNAHWAVVEFIFLSVDSPHLRRSEVSSDIRELTSAEIG